LDAPEHFKAWQQGVTGFPIIDAAMIQLKRTGWMHNRLRMLTASFLCKLLMIDWRLGEAHFMELLLDGDFSSNNGGWQWSASVGCDAAPWFRIFNPTSQSKKFDSKGDFIRKMLPRLSELSDKDIHWPSNEQRKKFNYSQPIIDYASCRKRALNWKK
jgi:deoxyribodipyrimidine photo-lyase